MRPIGKSLCLFCWALSFLKFLEAPAAPFAHGPMGLAALAATKSAFRLQTSRKRAPLPSFEGLRHLGPRAHLCACARALVIWWEGGSNLHVIASSFHVWAGVVFHFPRRKQGDSVRQNECMLDAKPNDINGEIRLTETLGDHTRPTGN